MSYLGMGAAKGSSGYEAREGDYTLLDDPSNTIYNKEETPVENWKRGKGGEWQYKPGMPTWQIAAIGGGLLLAALAMMAGRRN